MSIFPLPVYETDGDPAERSALTEAEQIARLRPPKTIVVRFGRMKMVGEYRYDGTATPGCGSKLVARTHRGTELGEMLTTTCDNSGCGKSVTRKELREYIEASGGKDYPFHDEGRVLRVATVGDLNVHAGLEDRRPALVAEAKAAIADLELEMKLVDVEQIMGGELITCWFTAEDRVDFRELVRVLSGSWNTRVLLQQVGARDEARLVADYERCGQYCCCKNFLKVLKPVSMGAAKMQKASLDPLKISGRCGRLMCCLRYEDATYRELKAKLPHRKSRVGTTEGPGIVVDSKVLVQLALVKLEHDGREIAVPIEELLDPDTCPSPEDAAARAAAEAAIDPMRGAAPRIGRGRGGKGDAPPERRGRRGRNKGGAGEGDAARSAEPAAGGDSSDAREAGERPSKSARRRRRGRGGRDGADGAAKPADPATRGSGRPAGDPSEGEGQGDAGGATTPKRRRRRRGRGGGDAGETSKDGGRASSSGSGSGGGGGGGSGDERSPGETTGSGPSRGSGGSGARSRRRRRRGRGGGPGGGSEGESGGDPRPQG